MSGVMARILWAVVAFAWALWLGGLVTLSAVLAMIFQTPGYTQTQRGDFAARLFPVFERMQLGFAAVALLGTAALWIARRTRMNLLLFILLAAATLHPVIESTMLTPRIEAMRQAHEQDTPRFERYHRASSRVYMMGAVVLLVCGIVLVGGIRSDAAITTATPRTSEETDPA